MVATELASRLNVDIPQLPWCSPPHSGWRNRPWRTAPSAWRWDFPFTWDFPFITGSSLVTKVLTEDMLELTGGQVIVNSDATATADILEQIIKDKRKGI